MVEAGAVHARCEPDDVAEVTAISGILARIVRNHMVLVAVWVSSTLRGSGHINRLGWPATWNVSRSGRNLSDLEERRRGRPSNARTRPCVIVESMTRPTRSGI